MESVFLLDEISVFTRGLVLGVVIAAPVGPIGLLCIRRTLEKGIFAGLATGFGAAVADVIFAAIAAFGITAALTLLTGMEKEIRFFGGFMLMVMAIRMFLKKMEIEQTSHRSAAGLLKAFITGFLITITNPLTILGVLAVIATFAGHLEYVQAATLTGGIFCGSLAWWVALSGGVFLIRKHFTSNALNWVNRGTAVLLLVLSVWAIFTGIAAYFGLPMLGPKL
ncbi:MAG: lysine transporter LysE [Alphaproteobacteria bacterium]|nr:lysine transporter LysE [Alphaproteobacteria bacterium]